MTPSERCLELIKSFESFRAVAYQCPGGKWTVGYGTTDGIKQGDTITQEEADTFLARDVARAAESVKSLVHTPLNQNQFDALVSFVYNVGSGNFAKSTLLRRINDGRWDWVPGEFMKWIYINGNPSNGLRRRRKDEVKLFLTGASDSR